MNRGEFAKSACRSADSTRIASGRSLEICGLTKKNKKEQKGSESNKFGNNHTSKPVNQVALTCA